MSLRRSARLGAIPSLTAPMSSSAPAPAPALKVTRHHQATQTYNQNGNYKDTKEQTNNTSTSRNKLIILGPSTHHHRQTLHTPIEPPHQGLAHLIATDPRLKPVIEAHPCPLFSPTGLAEQIDPFNSLTSSIIGQQVSGAAAKSIRNKFVALFNLPGTAAAASAGAGADAGVAEGGLAHSRFPTPEIVARCDLPTLRTAGLSQRKAEYIQGLAEKFASGELSARILATASDEELVERLTAVRGLGGGLLRCLLVLR
ncbi:DNA glycosylase [Penicillium cosmopolitanum]|uniref:DNA glycosylase n=1 Tax=Penicillium cosmopolitanum TaxID=1131564 RepID=A0A9W9W4J3_9EURO|nr:DNA glycosylase [Penicillium cosmopolitanum]KAJ5403265.1 DNA glycosylase [Penicillium cosmopolitanum]